MEAKWKRRGAGEKQLRCRSKLHIQGVWDKVKLGNSQKEKCHSKGKEYAMFDSSMEAAAGEQEVN